jgi:hypothetical protein
MCRNFSLSPLASQRAHNVPLLDLPDRIPIEWADVTNIHIGPISAERARVMVINLANYSELARNVDGIIGLDLSSRTKCLLWTTQRRGLFRTVRKLDDRRCPGATDSIVRRHRVSGYFALRESPPEALGEPTYASGPKNVNGRIKGWVCGNDAPGRSIRDRAELPWQSRSRSRN